jgi:hypothetical protein
MLLVLNNDEPLACCPFTHGSWLWSAMPLTHTRQSLTLTHDSHSHTTVTHTHTRQSLTHDSPKGAQDSKPIRISA